MVIELMILFKVYMIEPKCRIIVIHTDTSKNDTMTLCVYKHYLKLEQLHVSVCVCIHSQEW